MASKYDDRGLPVAQGFYWKRNVIYVKIHGKQYSTGTNKVPLAVVFKEKTIAEENREREQALKPAGNMKLVFADYLEYLKDKEKEGGEYAQGGTRTSYRTESVIRLYLEPFFGRMAPADVRLKLLDYKKLRAEAKATSFNGELRILSAALNVACASYKIGKESLPVKYPFRHKEERQAARKGIITDDQRTLIMEHASPHLKPIFATCMDTGIRPKELRYIRPSQVFLDDNARIELKDGETKNGEGRTVVVNDELKKILLDWRKQTKKEHPHARTFFHLDGERLGDWGTAWNGALRRAGLRVKGEDGVERNVVMFYDARRTARTKLDEIGVSQADAKLQMGHKTDAMSTAYNQSKKGLERIREAQNAQVKGKVTEAAPIAPAAIVRDWKAELRDLKETFDAGLVPEDLYRAEVAKVLAGR